MTAATDAPIGIFDSGFGGLTVARSVIDQLPHESVHYLGDTARQPYGQKPIGEVREYALECLDHLYAQGVKALVIACNSASAAMLRDARERYDVPVVEVILPATRRAVAASRTGRIGVICTRATAASDGLRGRLRRRAPRRAVDPGLPELRRLRRGRDHRRRRAARGPRTTTSTRSPPPASTHWCWAAPTTPCSPGVISYVMGDNVTLVSSAEESAKDVYKMLVQQDLMRPGGDPTYRFDTTGAPEEFETIGRRFLGPEMVAASQFVGGMA